MTKKKTLVFALSVLLCMTMVFAQLFIITHYHHDCCGENCPVCREIAACTVYLHGAGSCLIAVACVLLFSLIILKVFIIESSVHNSITLVSLKVKLTN